MANALDTFRAQREAADLIHAQLLETAALLRALQTQVSAITRDGELAALVREERSWLIRLENALAEARRFRELESRQFWPGVVRRWVTTLVFAFVALAAVGAGYVWAYQPHRQEIEALRRRAELFDIVTERVIAMSPAERRQFDALLGGSEGR